MPQIPAHLAVPSTLDGDVIDLEGHQLRIIPVAQADTAPSRIVHIPDLNAVIAGDVADNGIHPWLAFTDHDKRMRWIASVEQVEALDPGSLSPATSARTHPTMTRPPSSAVPRPTSAISNDRWPAAIRPRGWWTR